MTTPQDQIDQFVTDSGLAHQIVHGDATTTVATAGGPVRSMAKFIADNQAAINAAMPNFQAIADGTADDAGALTGAETKPLSRGAGLLQTTLAHEAIFNASTALVWQVAAAGTIARTLTGKLKDQSMSITDFGAVADGTRYATSGGTDNSLFINAAITAASLAGIKTITVPDGVYNFGSPIYLVPGVSLEAVQGRPCFNAIGPMTVAVESPLGATMNNDRWYDIDILLNSLVSEGFYLQWIQGFFMRNTQVEDFNQQGYIIGNPAATPYQSAGFVGDNVTTMRNSSTVPASTIGMWVRASSDTLLKNGGFVGAVTGLQTQSGGYFENVHNWTRASTGAMQTGFVGTGGSAVFVGCQADTATVNGFDLTGTGYRLVACQAYNNGGTTATDNVVAAVKFRTVNPQSSVIGLLVNGVDATHRFATDISTADGTQTGLQIVGSSCINVVNPINVNTFSNSLSVGDNLSSATNLTVNGADNTNRQRIWATGGVPMWIERMSNQNTGNNHGSDLSWFSRTDAGAGLRQDFQLVRSNGQWTIGSSASTSTHLVNGVGLQVNGTLAATGIATFSAQVGLANYTVATLPSVATNGQLAYASNGRKVGEGTGSGTGVNVYYSNTAWRVHSTDAAVAA